MTADIGADFRAMHVPGDPFILANAWDLGSAKMLVGLGAKAIGTSSAALAFTHGRVDGVMGLSESLDHAALLAEALPVPVQGDFENGFGHTPEDCAETVRLSVDAGLAGLCIEDTGLPETTPYPFDLAVERVAAAAEAAKSASRDIVFCARADGLLLGTYGMDEAIRRLKAFEAAGADCLYAPAPPSMADLARICREVTVPVNALAAGRFTKVSRAEYAAAGVARISLGSALARATHRVIHNAGRAMFEEGDFTPLSDGLPFDTLNALLEG